MENLACKFATLSTVGASKVSSNRLSWGNIKTDKALLQRYFSPSNIRLSNATYILRLEEPISIELALTIPIDFQFSGPPQEILGREVFNLLNTGSFPPLQVTVSRAYHRLGEDGVLKWAVDITPELEVGKTAARDIVAATGMRVVFKY